ncbi:hypothetical protein [Serratia fonticola]|uniref:hypothetical protein n=1 Tax=Serratia fonticola TaxID=47917 RepID=UPI001C4838AD|nr:hypothetical protein [Serratia fonticola]QXN62123.1 hypothetical protein J8M99_22910 [Serratia fonticola]
MIHELKISPDYPNNYWFEYEQGEVSNNDLIQCKEVRSNNDFIFKAKRKVSEKSLLSYDFCFSDGPIFISPRLVSLLLTNKGFSRDVQLLDAVVVINNLNYLGCKVINVIRSLSCIDMDRSDSQPILSYLPDGPRKFNEIVFKENLTEDFCIARCVEYKPCIVMSNALRDFFIENNVRGLKL